MTFPFAEPLVPVDLRPRVIPEPPRPGDPDGEPCRICGQDDGIWSDRNWVLHNPAGGSLPGTVWLASRTHADSFADLSDELATDFGRVAARVERAILSLGDVGRVHVYRWGDGVAHFHVWFMPRPLGMLEATRHMLPLWEDRLPAAAPEAFDAAGRAIASALHAPVDQGS